MKLILMLPLFFISFLANAQDSSYSINSYLSEGFKAPNTHHIGDAWLSFLLEASEGFDFNITHATFSANSTLDWHKHQTVQILIIVEGEGYYQERGKEPIILKKGDILKCEKETEHWHSSTIDNDVSYLAIYGSEPTEWTEKLTQEYYNSVAEKLKSN